MCVWCVSVVLYVFVVVCYLFEINRFFFKNYDGRSGFPLLPREGGETVIRSCGLSKDNMVLQLDTRLSDQDMAMLKLHP